MEPGYELQRVRIQPSPPIHLSGEIIQIGAVKLDDDFCPAEEFQSDVRPILPQHALQSQKAYRH